MQKFRCVRVGDLKPADRKKHGVEGVPDNEHIGIAIEEPDGNSATVEGQAGQGVDLPANDSRRKATEKRGV